MSPRHRTVAAFDPLEVADEVPLTEVPTPFLRVDAAAVRRNVERLAGYAAAHRLRVRPHAKTHKSLHVGSMQLEAGAAGLTVAKVGEAEAFAAVCDDLLLAYPVVDPDKGRRLARLAGDRAVRVAVDSAAAMSAVSAAAALVGTTVGVLVDLDVGHRRTGAQSPEQAVRLARLASSMPGLRLDGLFCYPGHIQGPVDGLAGPVAAVSARLGEALHRFRAAGLSAEIVSGGSTPTAFLAHLDPHLTEIRPGTYVYNDANCLYAGYCDLADCAVGVVATVVSSAVPGQVVIDAGTKTLSSDRSPADPRNGFGFVIEYPEAVVRSLNEEHGMVDVSACRTTPEVGERLTVIPNHVCPCVNLHDRLWWWEGGEAVRPLTVDARGRVS